MTHIFINYNQDKYFLAHVWEQFLFNELKFYGYHPKANIGNGIIYFKIKKEIDYKTFLSIASRVKLKNSYYRELVAQIQKETLNNIKTKAAFECVNYNVKNLNELKKILINSLSQLDFEDFSNNILKSNAIVIYSEKEKKIIYQKGKFVFKKNVYTPHSVHKNNGFEITFKTNAKTIVDAIIYSYISKKLGFDNYLWLSTQKQLNLTILSKKPIKKLNEKVDIKIDGFKFEFEDENINSLWQSFDWGNVSSLKFIKSELKKINKVNVNISEKNIRIKY